MPNGSTTDQVATQRKDRDVTDFFRLRWREKAGELEREGVLPKLARLGTETLQALRGRAKVRWRAG